MSKELVGAEALTGAELITGIVEGRIAEINEAARLQTAELQDQAAVALFNLGLVESVFRHEVPEAGILLSKTENFVGPQETYTEVDKSAMKRGGFNSGMLELLYGALGVNNYQGFLVQSDPLRDPLIQDKWIQVGDNGWLKYRSTRVMDANGDHQTTFSVTAYPKGSDSIPKKVLERPLTAKA